MLMSEKDLIASAIEVLDIMQGVFDEWVERGIVNRPVFYLNLGYRVFDDGRWRFRLVQSRTYGDVPREDWEYPFDDIADGKAEITGRTGLSTREVILQRPELLLPSDVRYWGSWIDRDLIAAGSAWKSHRDEGFCKTALGLWVPCLDEAHTMAEARADERAENDESNGHLLLL